MREGGGREGEREGESTRNYISHYLKIKKITSLGGDAWTLHLHLCRYSVQVYMRTCVSRATQPRLYEQKYTPSAFEEVDDGSRVTRQPEAVQKAAERERRVGRERGITTAHIISQQQTSFSKDPSLIKISTAAVVNHLISGSRGARLCSRCATIAYREKS